MNDLTILYASASAMREEPAQRIRENLLEITQNKYPVVSVTQKPIKFGKNICVGEIGKSKYNEFKQILIGVKEIKTKYTAVVDDDTLYCPEHFDFRPLDGIFSYERNYWFAEEGKDYYWRIGDINKRGGMWGCIANTKALLNNLTARYEAYPTDPWAPDSKVVPPPWGEPGVHDQSFGMSNKIMFVNSEKPCLIFIHHESMGYNQLRRFYRRYGLPKPEDITYNLERFGVMKNLWDKYWK